jgi:hypothetical protein
MQLSSEINPYQLSTTGANVGRLLPVRGWQLMIALAAVVLASFRSFLQSKRSKEA